MKRTNYAARLWAILAACPGLRIHNDDPTPLGDLLERRQAVLNRRQARVDAAEAEDRDFTNEETEAETADAAEFQSLTNRIDRRRDLANALPANGTAGSRGDGSDDPNLENNGGTAGETNRPVVENGRVVNRPNNDPERGVPRVLVINKRLTAFSNDREGHVSAYRFGKWCIANIFGNEFVRGLLPEDSLEVVDAARKFCIDNAMSGDVDSKGGYYVPDEWSNRVIDLAETYGVFRRRCGVEPMASDTKLIPKKLARVTVEWVSPQGTAISESDQDVGQVQLVAKKLAGLTRVSTELAEDNIVNLGDDLARDFAWAFSNAEDDAGFNGDGGASYGGISGLIGLDAGSLVVTSAGEQAFSDLTMEHFESMIGLTPHYPMAMPAWFISKAGYHASMARLIDAVGGNRKDDVEGGKSLFFLGYPVEFTQVLPQGLGDQASTNLVYFGDLSLAARMGQRRAVSIMQSAHRYFENDQIGVRSTERVDIQIHEGLTAATSPGPVVGLQTNAA